MLLTAAPLALAFAIADPPAAQTAEPLADPIAAAIADGVKLLLEKQEGDDHAEWPYEGVYRVGGEIPIGYRVGGSAIVAEALIAAPGYGKDESRRQAVERALAFICASIDHPEMAHEFQSHYDVRGWGYTYGLDFLLRMKKQKLVPDAMHNNVEAAITFYLDGLKATEIPEVGGWNYSRPRGFDNPSPQAPFMTGPTLLTLYLAQSMGYDVDQSMIEHGIEALERSRTPDGAVLYSGGSGANSREPVPGAVGRMLVTEIALNVAGKSSPERLRGAIDAFLVHWSWLDKRRAQNGTHVPPYMIAPYYFYYAHYFAAEAVELLPRQERDEYRRLVRERIFSVRLPNGSWNDRVFPRSASYGTAMCMLALMMPDLPAPAKWEAPKPETAPQKPATVSAPAQ